MSRIYISYMSCIWILNAMRCRSYMCLICIWPVYGSNMASTVNSYNAHIWTSKGPILDFQWTS